MNFWSLKFFKKTSKEYLKSGLKFVYSEKAAKYCKISTLLLSTVHTDKRKVEISQNFVAFSEYINFKQKNILVCQVAPD